jgi:5-formyltetrahydrofolate cyclo-ligase
MTKLEDSIAVKPALRAALKRERAALEVAEWRDRSLTIVQHVQRYLEPTAARRVGLYAPMESRREVDVRPLDAWLRSRGAAVAYPTMQEGVLGFAWVRTPSALTTRSLFPQPDASCPRLAAGELDVIVVPALAATPTGFRLGYGSGFYDRVLHSFCPPATSVCVVFESQLRTVLPVDAHDVPCHVVITERGIASS